MLMDHFFDMNAESLLAGDELYLIAQAVQGNHDAFRLLVVRYESRIMAYLYAMVLDREVAQDLTQDVFVSAYQALHRWQPMQTDQDQIAQSEQPLAPWLYRIATNLAISHMRKQMVRARYHVPPQREGEEDLFTADMLIDPETRELDERFAARELLYQALRKLSERDAAILIWHFVDGEKYAVIANRLGITEVAVRKRVSRAIPLLREIYQNLVQEGEKL